MYMPTQTDILKLQVGDSAPNCFGQLKEVTEIIAREQDINGFWFVCYKVRFGAHSTISHSLKEGRLDRNTELSRDYTSIELDKIEEQMRKERTNGTQN